MKIINIIWRQKQKKRKKKIISKENNTLNANYKSKKINKNLYWDRQEKN